MRKTILAVAFLVSVPSAVLADPPTPLPEPGPTIESAGQRANESLICHYYYHEGEIVRRPICKTEREWVRFRLEQQKDVSDFQLRSYSVH